MNIRYYEYKVCWIYIFTTQYTLVKDATTLLSLSPFYTKVNTFGVDSTELHRFPVCLYIQFWGPGLDWDQVKKQLVLQQAQCADLCFSKVCWLQFQICSFWVIYKRLEKHASRIQIWKRVVYIWHLLISKGLRLLNVMPALNFWKYQVKHHFLQSSVFL